MASPDFGGPLTQLPQAQGLEAPSATEASQSQAEFFQNMTNMFTREAQRVDERRLQEKEREARQEATERGIEAGTESAEKGISPKQKEEDSLYNRVFNKQAVDAWQSQTRIEAYEFAEEQYEENKFDPKAFRENIEEYQKGVENELPEEAIPQFRATVNRQKERFLPRIERNYTERKQQEHRNVFTDELKKKRKAIRDMATENPESQQTLNNIKQEFDSALNVIAQYGPEGEFELAGRTFSGGNGAIGLDEAKEMYDNLRRTTASELIITKFRKQGSLDDMKEYRSQFAKDMDRPREEQAVETGTEMVLSDETRQNILERMDTMMDGIEGANKIDKQANKDFIKQTIDELNNGFTQSQQDMVKTRRKLAQLQQVDESDYRDLSQELVKAQDNKKAMRTSVFTVDENDNVRVMDLAHIDQKIQELKDKANNASGFKQERLINQYQTLQDEKSDLQSAINSGNAVGYFMDKMSNMPGSVPQQVKEKMGGGLEPLPTNLRQVVSFNEEGDPELTEDGEIKLNPEAREATVNRIKKWSQFSNAFNISGGPISETEKSQMKEMFQNMNAEQKATYLGLYQGMLQSEDKDVRNMANKALKTISSIGGDGESSTSMNGSTMAHITSIAATSPTNAKKAIQGLSILDSDPNFTNSQSNEFDSQFSKITSGVFGEIETGYIGLFGDTSGSQFLLPEMRRNVKTTAKAMFARDVDTMNPENVKVTEGTVREYMNRALGAKKTNDGQWKGGLSTFDYGIGQIILPQKDGKWMEQETFNRWWGSWVNNQNELEDDMFKMLSRSGQQPMHRSGKFTPEQIDSVQRLIPTGAGTYYVELKDEAFLKRPDGENYELDMRKLVGKEPPDQPEREAIDVQESRPKYRGREVDNETMGTMTR